MKTPCLTCGKQSLRRASAGSVPAAEGRGADAAPHAFAVRLRAPAQAFAEGQERFDTPCAPAPVTASCCGKTAGDDGGGHVCLQHQRTLHREIANVPGRLTAEHHPLFVRDQSGRLLSVPSRRHQNANSDHYVKLEPVMFHRNILRRVPFGNAECLLFRGKDLPGRYAGAAEKRPGSFGSGAPVPPEWY